jgi:hypothetical protein
MRRRYGSSPRVFILVGVLFAFFALPFLAVGFFLPGDSFFRLAFIGVPVTFGVLGALLVIKGVSGLLARTVFHVATLTPTAGAVALGSTARVKLDLSPKRDLKVKGGKLTFTTEEEAIYVRGSDRRTYREVVFEWTTPINLPEGLSGPYQRELRIPIPKELPPTFRGQYNAITSRCDVTVELAGLPNLELSEDIVIAPEVTDERAV